MQPYSPDRMMATGANMLVPQPYDPAWTGIGETFNDYPPPPPPGVADAQSIANAVPGPGVPVPFGPVEWNNPTDAVGIPLNAGSPSQVPVLAANKKRNLLVVQNNSTATSPDVAPDLYVEFGRQANRYSLKLAPGIGVVFDVICPRSQIYVAFLNGSGASATPIGVVVQGSHTPDVDLQQVATAMRFFSTAPMGDAGQAGSGPWTR